MSFRRSDTLRGTSFNSAQSLSLLEDYIAFYSDKIRVARSEPSHRRFAPSSLRCDRISWFRLRGVYPDMVAEPDMTLEHTANIGTACHRIIQENLSEMLGDDWIDVASYITSAGICASAELDPHSKETIVTITDPPVSFACDGIVRRDGQLYLLEIKTCDTCSWSALSAEKPQHRDQVICYCSLLHLNNVLYIYQDRTYGGLKCFEAHVPEYLQTDMLERMQNVMKLVESGIAPDPLPKGDSWCTSTRCPYYKTCREYGRYE